MAEPTPGPWRWTTVDYCGRPFENTYKPQPGRGPFDALWSDGANRPVFVAKDASDYSASCEFENEADRHLIAAAGDLQEALEACLHAMNHAYGGADFAVLEKSKARAALAKARGEG